MCQFLLTNDLSRWLDITQSVSNRFNGFEKTN